MSPSRPGQRMFVAVTPPEGALADLDEFLARRRDAADFRWTLPEHLHLTLAFLPAVTDRALDDLVERLGRAAARRTPFAARIAGGGSFPNPARAKVLYAGLELDEPGRVELGRLAIGARAAASRAGAEVDGARFRPHLTVARLRRPADTTNWVRLLDAYAGPGFAVDSITLVASYLGDGTRGRPRYEEVAELALGRTRRAAGSQ